MVVATRDLQIGTLIGPSDVRMGPWAGALPKDALSKLDLALNRGATANIYEGEPVLAERLAAPGSGGGLAAIIPPGMRASAVKVNEVVGLAGFVTPGMRVDVLMSGIQPGGNPAVDRASIRCCRTSRSCQPARISRRTARVSRTRSKSSICW